MLALVADVVFIIVCPQVPPVFRQLLILWAHVPADEKVEACFPRFPCSQGPGRLTQILVGEGTQDT